jgi:CheY-like chemotaxis protein
MAMRQSVSHDSDPHAIGGSAKPRILVVDDNADAANSLGRLLGLLGNEVRVANDGAAALVEIERFQPRAVLLDLGMPIMDGFEAAEQIRARPEWQHIALVAVTGWGQDRDRQRTQEAGFVAHLIKPVDLNQLEIILRRIMAGDQGSSAAASKRSSG